MIAGVGTDLVEIGRISAIVQRRGDAFARRILGKKELLEYQARLAKQSVVRANAYLASRFAAKEAFSKAIGLGLRWPMTLHDMQTLNITLGAPRIFLCGELKQWVEKNQLIFHLSISDSREYAIATVIASRKY